MTGTAAEVPSDASSLHTTSRFRVLDHDFAVRATDPALTTYLEALLHPFAVDGTPTEPIYSLVELHDGPEPGAWAVLVGRHRLNLSADPSSAVDWLLWHIHLQALSLSSRYLIVHAGAVASGGVAVVFPGPSGAGKTTLVAGLVQAGMGYLSDEAVAFDGDPPLAYPYPKPLSIKAGAHQVLPHLEPHGPPSTERYFGAEWHVPVSSIRANALVGPCRPTLVIAPRYRSGASTTLLPMTPMESMLLLAGNAFNLRLHGQRGLSQLGKVVRHAACHQLVFDDLHGACDAVLHLLHPEQRP